MIVNQGKLSEAAYYTIPFLHEILESPIQNGRHLLYNLLFEFSHKHVIDYDKKIVIDGISTPLKKACREKVFDGRRLYYLDLQNSSSKVRYLSFVLLLLFNEHYPVIYEEIKQISIKYAKYLQKHGLEIEFYDRVMLRDVLELILFPD